MILRRLASAVLAPLALLSLGASLWLFSVVLFVLPARDPAHVPLWTGIAWAFAAHAALSLASIAAPSRASGAAATAASAVALAAGVAGLALTLRADAAHFEGYAVVLSALLLAHGAAGTLRERAVA
jgi:FtsH-binding integral membrane protein